MFPTSTSRLVSVFITIGIIYFSVMVAAPQAGDVLVIPAFRDDPGRADLLRFTDCAWLERKDAGDDSGDAVFIQWAPSGGKDIVVTSYVVHYGQGQLEHAHVVAAPADSVVIDQHLSNDGQPTFFLVMEHGYHKPTRSPIKRSFVLYADTQGCGLYDPEGAPQLLIANLACSPCSGQSCPSGYICLRWTTSIGEEEYDIFVGLCSSCTHVWIDTVYYPDNCYHDPYPPADPSHYRVIAYPTMSMLNRSCAVN